MSKTDNTTLVFGRGSQEFKVTIGAMYENMNGGYERTLRVKADNWRAAKKYVEDMDPERLWVDYAKVLTMCKCEPIVHRVTDAKGIRSFLNFRLDDLVSERAEREETENYYARERARYYDDED